MSAWIVSRNHIRYLVHALGKYELLEKNTLTTGQMLWDENIQSVQYRYGDEDRHNLPGPIDETYVYTDGPITEVFHPAIVTKACECYEYQSCEHPGWKDSEACRLVTALEALANKHNRCHRGVPAYDNAPWGID